MKLLLMLVFLTLTYACSESENDAVIQPEQEVESIFETQLDALDKSKEVEGMLEDAVKKRDVEMRNQGI